MISIEKKKFLYTYDNPILWNISCVGNIKQLELIDLIIKILKENNIPIPFTTLHGSFMCKYNGGRVSRLQHDVDINISKNFDKFLKKYNDLGIGIKLTFSKMNLHKEQFEEKEMRWYLDLLNETKGIGNGIICVNDDFAELVKKNYPDLDLVASYVKMELETKMGITDTVDYYNSKFDLYDIVVMNNYRAFNDDFLSKINHPEKVEFIVNHYCSPNCPYGAEHHKLSEAEQQAFFDNNMDIDAVYNYFNSEDWFDKQFEIVKKCSIRFNNLSKIQMQNISRDEINYLSNTFGINRFKIEGRDYPAYDLLIDLLKYIINIEGPYLNLYRTFEKNQQYQNMYNKKNNINKNFNIILPNKVKLF